MRRACCRGLNDYYADHWMGHADRMTPVAIIPMSTPEEAIDELDYAVRRTRLQGGDAAELREAAARSLVGRRGGPFRVARRHVRHRQRARLRPRVGEVPRARRRAGFHGPGEGSTFHDSISNPVYNHVGHFASAATAVCKSLFLGGVSHRFPELRFLFLEGGVGWARSLLADLTSHWEKRSLAGLARDSDPRLADADLFLVLYQQYGGTAGSADDHPGARRGGGPSIPRTRATASRSLHDHRADELRRLFVERFYFGCEGDDPVMPAAFDVRRDPVDARGCRRSSARTSATGTSR